jgi:rhodopsin domain-containing protein
VFLIYGVHWGLGQRLEVFNLITFSQINKWSMFTQVVIYISLSFSKMAVVAFLQRMHGPNDRNRVIFLWTVAGSNTIMNLIAMALMLTQCTPIAKIWDDSQSGSCASISRAQDYGYVQGSTLRPFISR